ncbi:calcyclin-binding protein [Lutzomyia longipalpis]|uniref:calcyclin-binding protein n=1 Tax=Lutzomyia longipalpis TaxID=7200 RepID=UPI002483F672|nr:calcyclin-binding protein [Lutzomyia longipalpis]
MDAKIEELKKDLEELGKLQDLAIRQRVKNALGLEKRRWETELSTLLQNQHNSGQPASSGVLSGPKRYVMELTNYAFDQSDAFVKIFVTLDGVQKVPEDGVIVDFTEKSLNLTVKDLNGRDYSLVVKNLLEAIDVTKSYRKIKTDLVAIYMKKAVQGLRWDCLTSTEKKVKDIKENAVSETAEDETEDSKDPSAGIMNIMKKMYESGDSDTKRMIAKAWTEAQEKRDTGFQVPEL